MGLEAAKAPRVAFGNALYLCNHGKPYDEGLVYVEAVEAVEDAKLAEW